MLISSYMTHELQGIADLNANTDLDYIIAPFRDKLGVSEHKIEDEYETTICALCEIRGKVHISVIDYSCSTGHGIICPACYVDEVRRRNSYKEITTF